MSSASFTSSLSAYLDAAQWENTVLRPFVLRHLEALNFTGADDEQDMDSYAIHGEFTSLLEVLLQKFAEAHAMSETDFEREVEAARKAGRERIATADDGDAAASSSAGVPLTVYRLLDLADYNCFMDYAAGFVATDEELEKFEEESGNSQQELFNHTKRNAWHDDDEPNELRVGGFVDSSDED